jgi:predicted transcriptional regulator
MNNLKLVEKLIIELGLSVREAKVYTTLFLKKDFTASEIQKLVNIPRTKIYEVLQTLISKGMCAEKKIGRYKKFHVLNPTSVFDKLKNDLVKKENTITNVLNIINPIFGQIKEDDNPLDYIEILQNQEEIRKKFLDLVKIAQNEILCFTKPPYASTHEDVISGGEGQPLINRSGEPLRVMDICEYSNTLSEFEKEDFVIEVSNFINNGEDVRIIHELPMKLVIIDEKTTILALNDPISFKPTLTTMVINHPSFAKSLKCVFESYWEKAMTFEEFKKKEKSKEI